MSSRASWWAPISPASGPNGSVRSGLPGATRDDPDRAARACLSLLDSSPRGLPIRASVHSGPLASIWMGSETRRSYELMGNATNVAARILELADWNQTVTSGSTVELMNEIEVEEREVVPLKGISRPLRLFAVVGERDRRPVRPMTPLVGRRRELRTIEEALERALDGRGATLAVTGPPGLGKSRMKWETARLARRLGFEVLEGRAPSFGGRPYGPVRAILRQALDGADRPDLRDALAGETARLGLSRVDRNHLEIILGLADDGVHQLKPGDARLNDRLAVRAFLRERARRIPQLFVLEDMQWADGSTREIARDSPAIVDGVSAVMLLLARPGYELPPDTLEIRLSDLSPGAVEELLGALVPQISEAARTLVVEKSEGNPFYVEEMVRHLLDSGVLSQRGDVYELIRTFDAEDLPRSVEAVIGVRLDRLSPEARRSAEAAAVIGRSFDRDILVRMSREAGMSELRDRELVFDDPSQSGMIWKHALTRDVMFGRILTGKRRRLHGLVADALEAQPGPRHERIAAIAHHREQSGETDAAIPAFLEAARQASRSHALAEAGDLYRRVVELSETVNPDRIDARNELGLNVLQRRGAMDEAQVEHERAWQEAQSLSDARRQAESLEHLGTLHYALGQLEDAERRFTQALGIRRARLKRERDGVTLSRLGDIRRERGHPEEARRLYEESLARLRDTGERLEEAVLMCNIGNLEVGLGRYPEARRWYESSVALARELERPVTVGSALGNLANMAVFQGNLEEARRLHEETLAVAQETGFRKLEGFVHGSLASLYQLEGRYAAVGRSFENALAILREMGDRQMLWALAGNYATHLLHLGDAARARQMLEEGIARLSEMGDVRNEAILVSYLGGLEREYGSARAARRHLERALVTFRRIGERWHEGVTLGSLGQLEFLEGRMEAAETVLQQAIDVSREVDDRWNEEFLTYPLAQVRVFLGRPDAAADALARAVTGWPNLGKNANRVDTLVVWGHLRLARGVTAEPQLDAALELADALELPDAAIARQALASLARAQAAFAAGEPLMGGYAPDDLTEGQRDWLARRGRT